MAPISGATPHRSASGAAETIAQGDARYLAAKPDDRRRTRPNLIIEGERGAKRMDAPNKRYPNRIAGRLFSRPTFSKSVNHAEG